MLTDRANKYLATLERRSAIATTEVEKILRESGHPCFAAWLEFHERYAGYVELWGHDWAVWGLVHENPYWLGHRAAEVEREPHHEIWYIACADVHPSYNYLLDDKGEFQGPPAQSFDVKVERNAVSWEFSRTGSSVFVPSSELREQSVRDRLLTEMKSHLVAAASDHFARCFMSEHCLAIENLKDGGLRVWRHANDERRHV